MNSDTDPNAATPRQANDNPTDGPAAARILVEKLRELAGLEDSNMKRCAGPIRTWSGEAADMIERLGQRASDSKKVGNPDLLAAPIREDVTREAREVARKFYGYDDEKDIEYWGPASAHHDVERLAKALEAFRLAHTDRPDAEAGDGYVTAFYEIAKMLGIGAQAASPADVWRDQMRPKLEALTARPDAGDEDVERVAFPDIGPDPMKGDRSDRFEQAIARVREAYVKQQTGVPTQTALVWRWDIGALISEITRLTALAAMREGVDRGMVETIIDAITPVMLRREGPGQDSYAWVEEAALAVGAAVGQLR